MIDLHPLNIFPFASLHKIFLPQYLPQYLNVSLVGKCGKSPEKTSRKTKHWKSDRIRYLIFLTSFLSQTWGFSAILTNTTSSLIGSEAVEYKDIFIASKHASYFKGGLVLANKWQGLLQLFTWVKRRKWTTVDDRLSKYICSSPVMNLFSPIQYTSLPGDHVPPGSTQQCDAISRIW